MVDYRALCARMADELDHYRRLLTDDRREAHALATEARALLDQQEPEPQPPVAGEVAEESWYPDFADWLEMEMPEGTVIGDPLWWASKIADRIIAADLLQHPQPVAVSERQPGPEHCDKWGQCWTTDYDPNLVYPPVWQMTELPRRDLGHDFSNAYFCRNVRFWLPANALPTPEAQ